MVRIIEVGPRDGLQNEQRDIPTDTKVAYVDALSRTGVDEIEVTAFVSPKWVPQLADAEQVLGRIARRAGVVYSALVPNEAGLERALRARVDKVAVFTAASETFNQRNINTSIAGSFERFAAVVPRARAAGLRVRGYVSTAFWCPYEGRIATAATLDVARRLAALGVGDISIGDTIGKATPEEVTALCRLLLAEHPAERLALHFHDTYGRAVDNVLAAYACGVRAFDASAGGVGGCPYAPGASGNVATEAVVEALRRTGVQVTADSTALRAAAAVVAPFVSNKRKRAQEPTQ